MMVINMGSGDGFLDNLPTKNKDNFRIYNEEKPGNSNSKQSSDIQRKKSNYPTTSDTPSEQRIVNESKPQVTLKYLRFRGNQYNSSSQSERNPAKRKRLNCVKAQP